MVVSAYVFETLTGQLLDEFQPYDARWQARLNADEDVTVHVDLRDVVEARRGWRNLATELKHSVALDVGGRVYGGPIEPHDFDGDEGTLELRVSGIRGGVLAHRSVLPPRALTTSLTRPDGMPDTSLDTALTGLDFGTIGKRIVQQAMAWPGGVPIVYEDDRMGTREKTYPAIDRKNLDDALSDLSALLGGPDFAFPLRKIGEKFEWWMRSGTESAPALSSQIVHTFELGQESGLKVRTNPSRMGSLAWAEGGRANDVALVRALYDPALIQRGYPLRELETQASVNTVLAGTLDQGNAETLRTARVPWEFWSFDVRADVSPLPDEYGIGDYIDAVVTEKMPVDGGYIRPGTYRRRIVGLAGQIDDVVSITCGEAYDNG